MIDTRAVRVPLPPLPATATPTVTAVRRARLRGMCILAELLTRHGLEACTEPTSAVEVDTSGVWWCTVTAQTRPETWRTSRVRDFGPCDRCGRRGNGVHRTLDGWQCSDRDGCARAMPRRRVCSACGRIGTTYTHSTTPSGLVLCKTTVGCEENVPTVTAPKGVPVTI